MFVYVSRNGWWSQHEEIVHSTVEIHYCPEAHAT